MLPQLAHFYLFLWLMTITTMASPPSTISAQALKGCKAICGNVIIPYPFGTKEGCFHDQHFLITCNTTYNPPKLFLTNSAIEVANIYLQEGELIILEYLASACYDKDGDRLSHNNPWASFSKFKISNSRNKFTAVGCDTYAFIRGNQGDGNYESGCTAICDSINNVSNGSCTGVGCCQTSIPKRLNYFSLEVHSYHNHTRVWNISSCGYAFVVQENMYNFSSGDLSGLSHADKLPLVLDWAIGNETCDATQKSNENICGKNSKCVDSINGSGYRCNCSDGYQGNPYLPSGCQDIDECNDTSLNHCEINQCTNTAGSYKCFCPKGYKGDGRKDGRGCTRIVDQSLPIKIVTGTLASLAILLVAVTWVYLVVKKRKLIRAKEKFFRQNGGVMLQKQLSNENENSAETSIKIYTAEELEKATDFYAESGIIGRGGYGTVYKGLVLDKKVPPEYKPVAIKKSKVVDKTQIDQFINEVIVLSQIKHRNVVKLLGCCLETEVPLLVYEFIPNGTLYNHIHNRSINSLITWDIALRIASETAEVLSYLHSSASVPIIHRDVKSTNILLDENYTAKVSDFGASRLVPLDEMQVCTMVQGTLGYLDPEYMHTSQLTEKSDVYSFGVVLVELLTKRKVLNYQKPEKERNLAIFFVSSLKEGRLLQILDAHIVREASADKLVLISDLAKRCLSVKGEDRPCMKEVAIELEGLKTKTKHPWVSEDHEESENLVSVSVENLDIEGSTVPQRIKFY